MWFPEDEYGDDEGEDALQIREGLDPHHRARFPFPSSSVSLPPIKLTAETAGSFAFFEQTEEESSSCDATRGRALAKEAQAPVDGGWTMRSS